MEFEPPMSESGDALLETDEEDEDCDDDCDDEGCDAESSAANARLPPPLGSASSRSSGDR